MVPHWIPVGNSGSGTGSQLLPWRPHGVPDHVRKSRCPHCLPHRSPKPVRCSGPRNTHHGSTRAPHRNPHETPDLIRNPGAVRSPPHVTTELVRVPGSGFQRRNVDYGAPTESRILHWPPGVRRWRHQFVSKAKNSNMGTDNYYSAKNNFAHHPLLLITKRSFLKSAVISDRHEFDRGHQQ